MRLGQAGHIHGATGSGRDPSGGEREAGSSVWPGVRSRDTGTSFGGSLMTDVVMPQMGESIVEGTLTKWLKKQGERVERDEPLFEISTDKVDTEIPAPAAGTLSEVLVEEGKTVGINTIVARIDEGGGDGAGKKAEAASPAKPEAAAPPKKEAEAPKKEAEAPKKEAEAPAQETL